MIGAVVQTAVTNVAGLVAGRVICGLGVGLISMMVSASFALCFLPPFADFARTSC